MDPKQWRCGFGLKLGMWDEMGYRNQPYDMGLSENDYQPWPTLQMAIGEWRTWCTSWTKLLVLRPFVGWVSDFLLFFGDQTYFLARYSLLLGCCHAVELSRGFGETQATQERGAAAKPCQGRPTSTDFYRLTTSTNIYQHLPSGTTHIFLGLRSFGRTRASYLCGSIEQPNP